MRILLSILATGLSGCVFLMSAAEAQPFFVPGQASAQHELLSATRIAPTKLKVLFSRGGPTSTAFIEAEIDCRTDMSRMTRAGVARSEMQIATGNDQWRKNASVGWGVGVTQYACTKMGMR
jgi:hypothetical protein